MRIFLAIPLSPNSDFQSDLWRWNLHAPLVEMGHDVVLWNEGIQGLFDADPGAPTTVPLRARLSERFEAAVAAAHRERPLDLVFTYVSDSHLEAAAIDRVRGRVAPIVNFFCNNIHQFHLVRRIAPHFTACLVPEREALAAYRRAGAEALSFPMAANPALYRRMDVPVSYDITFAGQRYGERTHALCALREAELDAHAFGPGWEPPPGAVAGPVEARAGDAGNGAPTAAANAAAGPLAQAARLAGMVLRGRNPALVLRDRLDWRRLCRAHGEALHAQVSDDEYVALFSRSAVSLGFLVLGDTHRTLRPLRQIRLREFEATMAGAFYVTGWLDEIAEHFEIGREIVCYRSPAELVDRCRYYLRHPDERERIRAAGHARAQRDHTWLRRFETLFAELRRRRVLPA